MPNSNGDGPTFKPMPKGELDKIIARAEAQAQTQEGPVHSSIGIVPEDDDGRDEVGRRLVSTPRARQNPAPIPVAHQPKTYCESCGHVDSHAPGCPATRVAPETVNIAELAEQTEPSIRRELTRIAVGILKRVADRLEKK